MYQFFIFLPKFSTLTSIPTPNQNLLAFIPVGNWRSRKLFCQHDLFIFFLMKDPMCIELGFLPNNRGFPLNKK